MSRLPGVQEINSIVALSEIKSDTALFILSRENFHAKKSLKAEKGQKCQKVGGGSLSRIRTYGRSINSRELYR